MTNLLEYKIDLIAKALGVYEIVEAVSVMRRQHINDDGSITDVVDYYPAWRGAYGKFKLIHEYMNHDWQRERFAKYAGIAVESIPLYEGDQSLIRKPNRPHAKEVELATSIKLMITCGSKEDETKKQILKVLGNGRTHTSQPSIPQQPVEREPKKKEVKETAVVDEATAKKEYYNGLSEIGKGACVAKSLPEMSQLVLGNNSYHGWSKVDPITLALNGVLGEYDYPSGSSLLEAQKRVLLVNLMTDLAERLTTMGNSSFKVTNEAIMHTRSLYARGLELGQ